MNKLTTEKIIKLDKLYDKYINKLKQPLIELLNDVEFLELDNLTILCENLGNIENVISLRNGEIEDGFGYKYTTRYLHYTELSNLARLVLESRGSSHLL